jgi:phosphate starvation-inducible PhoH-like protein
LKLIKPRTENQEALVKSIKENIATIATGSAGCGKTLLSLYTFLCMIKGPKSKMNKIIYFRPAVPDRHIEDTGYLPGNIDDKLRGMCGGLFHNLEFIVGEKEATSLIEKGQIRIELLSHIRGSSYNNCCLLLDECSILHKSSRAIKLFLSRVGTHCRAVIIGDVKQSPLRTQDIDVIDAIQRLKDVEDIGIVTLDNIIDIQRSEFVRNVLKQYGDI